jgi:hypothetical protein
LELIMPVTVTETHIVSFRNNMQLALQTKRSKLWPYAMPETGQGELTELTNLLGAVTPTRSEDRYGDTKYSEDKHTRRWCAKDVELYYAKLVERDDQLRAGIDLQGGYVMTGAATVARAKDEQFLRGFYGVALTGKSGTTQVPFPAGQLIPAATGAAAATGMNVEKLIAARETLIAGDVDFDEEEAYCAITPKQEGELLRDLRATSRDFVSQQQMSVIESGKLPKLLGFNFIVMNYDNATLYPTAAPLTLDGSGHRRIPVWVKSGMCGVTWNDLITSIDRLPQKRNIVQVYAGTDVAASRTEEGKCVQILCAE